MKGYSTFPRGPEMELQHRLQFSFIPRKLVLVEGWLVVRVLWHINLMVWGSYSSAEMQSVYSTALADWAKS